MTAAIAFVVIFITALFAFAIYWARVDAAERRAEAEAADRAVEAKRASERREP